MLAMSEVAEKPHRAIWRLSLNLKTGPWEKESENKLLRKLDQTILPWVMLTYFISYMDR